MSQARVGVSGWRYPRWRGDFYPKGLRQKDELRYAAERMNSVEINGSFYSLQRPTSYEAWRDATPDGFVFAVKGGRFITHLKQLRDVETPLANFFASGVLSLGDRLGPILWQLPERIRFDPDRLAAFFELLPRTTTAAAELAERHDDKVPDDRAATKAAHPPEDPPRPRAPPRELRHRRRPRLPRRARHLHRRRRQRRAVAAAARRDERLPLRPAARGDRALRQRLHRRLPRPLGRPDRQLARRRP